MIAWWLDWLEWLDWIEAASKPTGTATYFITMETHAATVVLAARIAGRGGREIEYYPERIVKDRLKPGRVADERELCVKWQGWSSAAEDLTWESQKGLIEDGHAQLVLNYLQAQCRKGRRLVITEHLVASAAAEPQAEGSGG